MSFLKNGELYIDTSIDPRIIPNSWSGIPVVSLSVFWTGSYPNICSGFWQFKINGKYLETERNEYGNSKEDYEYDHFLTKDFGTFKNYTNWHFENHKEVWEDYEEGLAFEEWLTSDKFLELNELFKSNNFFLSREKLKLLYNKINHYDWRNNSCGGCI